MAGESKDGIEMRRMIDTMWVETISVRHMEGSSKYKPIGFDSWKSFWESKMPDHHFPSQTEKCACCKKDTHPDDFVGAHIVCVDNKKMYIYPLCNSCNVKYGEGRELSPVFEVKKSMCAVFLLSEARIEHPEE